MRNFAKFRLPTKFRKSCKFAKFRITKIKRTDMHAQLFTVKYSGATNTRGSRVIIRDQRFDKRRLLPFDYEIGNILDQALAYLKNIGYNIVAYGETCEGYTIAVSDFIPLNERGV